MPITIAVDTAKMIKLREKFGKYPPAAIRAGTTAAAEYMNSPEVAFSIYPPDRNGTQFMWSSDKQRRYVFANYELPYQRTMGLANAGHFSVNEQNFMIEYFNDLPWWIYVLHPSYQIIGHRMRGWKPINVSMKEKAGSIVSTMRPAVMRAWEDLESFMTGGGGGL